MQPASWPRRAFLRRSLGTLALAPFMHALSPVAAQRGSASSLYATVSLNTQDFAYPDLSAALVSRVLDLHDTLDVPLDVYLTTTMVDVFESGWPDVLERLRLSRVATACYHDRPPMPYHTGYDWLGVSRMSSAEQYDLIEQYETHGLDLATGRPTEAEGGYAKLTRLMGAPPRAVGILADGATLQASADTVFRDMGATFGVVHGRAANLGETRNGLLARPEHYDLKLFERVRESAGTVLNEAIASARTAAGGRPPYFVGVKMHDNDFFATQSAWTTVYLAPGARRGPPWNPALKAPLLDDAARAEMWRTYEAMIRELAARRSQISVVNMQQVLTMTRLANGATLAVDVAPAV
jgi:hypothetical protein